MQLSTSIEMRRSISRPCLSADLSPKLDFTSPKATPHFPHATRAKHVTVGQSTSWLIAELSFLHKHCRVLPGLTIRPARDY